jgi:hypothetical protein
MAETIMATKLLLQHRTGGTTLLTSNLRRHRTIKGLVKGCLADDFGCWERNVVRKEVVWLGRMVMKGVWIEVWERFKDVEVNQVAGA